MRKNDATPAIICCLFIGAGIVIIGTLLHSCNKLNWEQKPIDDRIAKVQVDVKNLYNKAIATNNDDIIERVTVNCHYYLIVFRLNNQHRTAPPVKEIVASLGHDPDCPCHRK